MPLNPKLPSFHPALLSNLPIIESDAIKSTFIQLIKLNEPLISINYEIYANSCNLKPDKIEEQIFYWQDLLAVFIGFHECASIQELGMKSTLFSCSFHVCDIFLILRSSK